MKENKKIIAVMSGGDWSDASVDHLVLLVDDVDLKIEKQSHKNWYELEYLPRLKAGGNPIYHTFTEWLIKKGIARKVKKNELEEILEDDL